AGARRRGRCGGGLGARPHGDRPRDSRGPGPARPRPDGRAVPRGGWGLAGGAARRAAVAGDARRPGAPGWQAGRNRHAVRPAAPAGRHSLMRVTVLTGGATAERAVAFASASQIVAALPSRAHEVYVVDTVTGLVPAGEEAALLSGNVGTEPP